MSTGLESEGGIFLYKAHGCASSGKVPNLSVSFLIYEMGLTVHGVAVMVRKRSCFLPPGIQESVEKALTKLISPTFQN